MGSFIVGKCRTSVECVFGAIKAVNNKNYAL